MNGRTAVLALPLAALLAITGCGTSNPARVNHPKAKIEVRYQAPAACSTALVDFRLIVSQLGSTDTDIGNWAAGSETESAMVSQIDAVTTQITAETAPLQAAELACDGS